MPGRFWKWRMLGGAVTLARQFLGEASAGKLKPDVIVATDLLDLATFLALTRRVTAGTAAVLYMHENQLTYPLPADPTKGPMRHQMGERDRHYALINYKSMLAADRVFFNSNYHLDSFFAALLPFLRHYPEFNEIDSIDILRQKSEVLPVGVDLGRLEPEIPHVDGDGEPLILWNHRLEYDKNPAGFIEVLVELAAEQVPFRVALCGERFGEPDPRWIAGVERLGERVVHNGFADDELYRRLLWESAVTISTADHDFFGLAVLEAMVCKTLPLLPARLSYPELLPAAFHSDCLYHGRNDLLNRLRWALTDPAAARALAARLAPSAKRFDWSLLAPIYDEKLAALGIKPQ